MAGFTKGKHRRCCSSAKSVKRLLSKAPWPSSRGEIRTRTRSQPTVEITFMKENYSATVVGKIAWALLAFISFTVVLCLVTPAQAGWTLYATGKGTQGQPNSGLYTIDPNSGLVTSFMQLKPPPSTTGVIVDSGGLAYDPATDILFATGQDASRQETLFTINRFDGSTKVIGALKATGQPVGYLPPGFSNGGLAMDPSTGNMYAVAANGQQATGLFLVHKTGVPGPNPGSTPTVEAEWKGQTEIRQPSASPRLAGLGFHDGVLYANGINPAAGANSLLFRVNVSDGATSQIGLGHGVTCGQQLQSSGLASQNGTLYSLGCTGPATYGLYKVDPGSGTATLIGPTPTPACPTCSQPGSATGGLAFAPAPLIRHLIPNKFLMPMLVLIIILFAFFVAWWLRSRRP
jgi:hypothetical protein